MSNRKFRGVWLAFLLIAATYWNPAPAWAANLQEVAPPAIISQLAPAASATPQIYITSPRAEEILPSGTVNVNLQVTGTNIFKNATFGIGPHLHLLLDGTPSGSVYDLSQPIALPTLTPGTHSLQVFAAKPWHESWKNPGALAQVTFHVLAKSTLVPRGSVNDSPNPNQPRLVYSPPSNFGAEPFLLDFDLTNPPQDWQVRATINSQSFSIDRWEPIYLKGLNPGANLIKLEYLDKTGQVLDSSIRVVNYQPNGQDGFSRLLRNEVPLANALALFDPNSRAIAVAPAALPQHPPSSVPAPSATPVPALPDGTTTPNSLPSVPAIAEPAQREIVPVTPPPIAAITPPVVPTASATPAPSLPPAPVTPAPAPVTMPTSPVVPIAQPATTTIPSPEPTTQPVVTEIAKPIVIPPTPISSAPLPAPTPPTAISPQPVLSVPVAAIPLPSPLISPVPSNPFPSPTKPLESAKANPPVAERPVDVPVERSPREIAAAPRTLAPQSGEEVVEFKVILRELFHTLGVRIKQATNQIPPLVARWSQNFGHWVSARIQAMRAPQTAPDAPESPV